MTAKFVLLGPKPAVLSVLNRVVDCVDFVTLDHVKDDSDVVLFDILTPNGSVLKCYDRESLSDWFERGAQELPDSRLPVQQADVERIITTKRLTRINEEQFRFYQDELQRIVNEANQSLTRINELRKEELDRETRIHERIHERSLEELNRYVKLNRELGMKRRICEDENERIKRAAYASSTASTATRKKKH